MDLMSSIAIEATADAPDRCAARYLDRARRIGEVKFVALGVPPDAGKPEARGATLATHLRARFKSTLTRVIGRLVAARP